MLYATSLLHSLVVVSLGIGFLITHVRQERASALCRLMCWHGLNELALLHKCSEQLSLSIWCPFPLPIESTGCSTQVAGSFQAGSCQSETPGPDSPHAHLRTNWPAGPAEDSEEAAAPGSFTSHHTSLDADSSQLSTSFPPNLPGLLTTHARSGSEELNLHEAESSRASSRIPAHSALSRMLQENSAQEHSLEEGAAWSLGAGGTTAEDA